ncbi:hypothetical protein WOLCODRAFT_167077 [Wolfiporia cocos MD-104 SS10]|uniref:PIN domain-like protein n=1 Tax=Wolfiporia cocos (strain MD-104) TaxID=742152 RepID=A0A2H3JA71_WOLCO|nr:hypothetical protein WOLCODRAFT_167077 [Wolfiporia cocos MD-104 SS10]
MGVHGLTTYLRENRTALARTIELPSGRNLESERIRVVVDGWSFIYELVRCADLPWVYGGEYDIFARLVERVIDAWIDAGLQLYFVFDGPYPEIKFPTVISRITKTSIQGGLLFFRTSTAARAMPHFLNETRMLPPHAYSVCVRTLVDLASSSDPAYHKYNRLVEVHFADEEGDPYAVALAGRLRAYVAGRDSDFVVLNAEGYRGYIPLDEMLWTATSVYTASASEVGSVYSSMDGDVGDDVDSDGFKVVHKPKGRKRAALHRRTGTGLVPPDDALGPESDLTLSFAVYTPIALADRLQIPVSLLPLLGALVGNDFTGAPDDTTPSKSTSLILRKHNLQRLFFDRTLTLSQRIVRVATTLRSILTTAFAASGVAQKRRNQKQIGSVMELIDAAVGALLVRSPDSLATGERAAIVERIADATLQYAIPPQDGAEEGWVSDVCPIHTRDACPLFALLSHSPPEQPFPPEEDAIGDDAPNGMLIDADEADPRARVASLYVDAYRRGALDPHVLDILSSGTCWPRLFLEDPDKETVAKSIGRPIREWCYALLESGVGLLEKSAPEAADESGEDDDEDELVDVEEDDGDVDPLAPLRGALKQLGETQEAADDHGDTANGDDSPVPTPRSQTITEYVRRGTRLAAEEVLIPYMRDLLNSISISAPMHQEHSDPWPVQLWPGDTRVSILLRAFSSDISSVRTLRGPHLALVLALRWVVFRMHARAAETSASKERGQERWRRSEVRAALGSFIWPLSGAGDTATDIDDFSSLQITIHERNIQLVAQLSMALEVVGNLSEVLLLSDYCSNPMRYFSGMRFHGILTKSIPAESIRIDGDLWETCVEGLEDSFMEEQRPKAKKERKKGGGQPMPTHSPKAHMNGHRGGGLYAMLGQLGD